MMLPTFSEPACSLQAMCAAVFGLFTVVVLPLLKMDDEAPAAESTDAPQVAAASQPAAIRGGAANRRR